MEMRNIWRACNDYDVSARRAVGRRVDDRTAVWWLSRRGLNKCATARMRMECKLAASTVNALLGARSRLAARIYLTPS